MAEGVKKPLASSLCKPLDLVQSLDNRERVSMSLYEKLGEASTKTLVKCAESWPKTVGLQEILAPVVREYQTRKEAGKTVGSWFVDC